MQAMRDSDLIYVCLQNTSDGQAAHTHVHEIISGLKEEGWHVRLLQPRVDKRPISLQLKNVNYGIGNRLLSFFAIQAHLIFMSRPKVIYLRHHFMSFPTVLWAKFHKIPIIVEVNGPNEDMFIAWPIAKYFAKFFVFLLDIDIRHAAGIIAVTPELKTEIQNRFPEKEITSINNGANTNKFKPAKDRTPELPYKYVIFFGALAAWQGVDTIIAACQLSEWPEDINLVIVGEGEQLAKLKEQAQASSRVFFIGKRSHNELPSLISNSIASIIPKNNLGNREKTGLSPLKLYESSACGVPIIVTDFPGLSDYVKSLNCGIVVEPDNAVSIARSVAYLNDNPEKAKNMGDNGRIGVLKSHSWKARSIDTHLFILKTLSETKLDPRYQS